MTSLDRLRATSLLDQRQGLNSRQRRVEIHRLADAILRLPKGTRAREDLALFR